MKIKKKHFFFDLEDLFLRVALFSLLDSKHELSPRRRGFGDATLLPGVDGEEGGAAAASSPFSPATMASDDVNVDADADAPSPIRRRRRFLIVFRRRHPARGLRPLGPAAVPRGATPVHWQQRGEEREKKKEKQKKDD